MGLKGGGEISADWSLCVSILAATSWSDGAVTFCSSSSSSSEMIMISNSDVARILDVFGDG